MSQEQVEKFIEIEEKLKDVSTRKIRIEEQYKNKKQALKDLVDEIKSQGYNPNELGKTIEKMESDLAIKLENFEKEIEEISKKLSEIEA